MISVDTIVGLIFGAGGIGSVTGWIKYRDWARKAKLNVEENTLTRLEQENRRAVKRADDAEASEDRMRVERDKARDSASQYKGMLIQAGLLKVDPHDRG